MPGMVRIGKLTLDAPFFQAGLAGYSDTAMRLIARRHGAPLAVTEALLDRLLIDGGKGRSYAELDEQDHPIAGQLIGSEPSQVAEGARILLGMDYDVIEVNLACPVRKFRKKGRGGHLLSQPDEAIAMLDAVRQAVPQDIPCTVKLRSATDDSAEASADFHRIFESVIELGYAAATIHARTVRQKYDGPADWPFLKALVSQYGKDAGTAIFGSGDIWSAQDIFRMIDQTGVQAAAVARGCIGNPWLFTQARAIMAGDTAAASCGPTIDQQRCVLLEHFDLSMAQHGERRAGRLMRKFGIKFARHHPDADAVAKAFVAVESVADWQHVVDTYYVATLQERVT